MSVQFRLKLYVAGASPKSERARANLAQIVAEHFESNIEIEVVDLLETPHLAKADRIVAIPTLVRHDPAPRATIVGDLSNVSQVLAGLGASAKLVS